MHREAVTGEIHDVHIRRPLRDALCEEVSGLVDHCVDQALDDLLIANLTPLYADLPGVVDDHVVHPLRRIGRAVAR